MIEILNLQKSFNHQLIINISHYKFHTGNNYLLVGENGSGKSTLIKLILGFIKPSKGNILYSDVKFSYAPEKTIYPDFITTKEFLKNILLIRNDSIEKIDDYLTNWHLDPNKKISHLSKGMKQKLNIIQALITQADIYLFDEPLNGLDKASQNLFLDSLNPLHNKMVIVATHYPEIYQTNFQTILAIKGNKLYETP